MTTMDIHGVKSIKIASHYPSNANHIGLSLCGDDNRELLYVSIYSLPPEVTAALIDALGAPDRVFGANGDVQVRAA